MFRNPKDYKTTFSQNSFETFIRTYNFLAQHPNLKKNLPSVNFDWIFIDYFLMKASPYFLELHIFLIIIATLPVMNEVGCPDNWLRAGQKCYKFNTGARHTWQESSDACRRRSSRLLQITTGDQKVRGWGKTKGTKKKNIATSQEKCFFYNLLVLHNWVNCIIFISINCSHCSWVTVNK